jgi:hypothetical protein
VFNHVTYELLASDLAKPELAQMMNVIGFREVEPAEPAPWPLRWFRGNGGPYIHLVGRLKVPMGLSHFCVEVAQEVYDGLRKSAWCTRDSGSGRIWLEAYGLRVEVRAYVD